MVLSVYRGRPEDESSDIPSASPGVSRRAFPARDSSPTLTPDSTTQKSYEYSNDESDYRPASQSEWALWARIIHCQRAYGRQGVLRTLR